MRRDNPEAIPRTCLQYRRFSEEMARLHQSGDHPMPTAIAFD